MRALPFLVLAVLIAGCGTKTIKSESGEDLVRKGMQAANAGEPTSVDCPDDVEAKVGETMVCHAKTDGASYTFTLKVDKVEGDSGHMTIVDAKKD